MCRRPVPPGALSSHYHPVTLRFWSVSTGSTEAHSVPRNTRYTLLGVCTTIASAASHARRASRQGWAGGEAPGGTDRTSNAAAAHPAQLARPDGALTEVVLGAIGIDNLLCAEALGQGSEGLLEVHAIVAAGGIELRELHASAGRLGRPCAGRRYRGAHLQAPRVCGRTCKPSPPPHRGRVAEIVQHAGHEGGDAVRVDHRRQVQAGGGGTRGAAGQGQQRCGAGDQGAVLHCWGR